MCCNTKVSSKERHPLPTPMNKTKQTEDKPHLGYLGKICLNNVLQSPASITLLLSLGIRQLLSFISKPNRHSICQVSFRKGFFVLNKHPSYQAPKQWVCKSSADSLYTFGVKVRIFPILNYQFFSNGATSRNYQLPSVREHPLSGKYCLNNQDRAYLYF